MWVNYCNECDRPQGECVCVRDHEYCSLDCLCDDCIALDMLEDEDYYY